MRVLVCGGRPYIDRAELYAGLDRLHAEYAFTTIIPGGAGGVDALALEWARRAASRRKRSERNGERSAA
ncbi:MAG: SLOG family protein [Xanthobacteraceae bacterium]